MEFTFTASIEGLGARSIAEENAIALLDAFEKVHPEVGAAVGAKLTAGVLEATFSVGGRSLDDAAEAARQLFAEVMEVSGLQPINPARFELEADLTEQVLAS